MVPIKLNSTAHETLDDRFNDYSKLIIKFKILRDDWHSFGRLYMVSGGDIDCSDWFAIIHGKILKTHQE